MEDRISIIAFVCTLSIFLRGKLNSESCARMLPDSFRGEEMSDHFKMNTLAIKTMVSTVRTKMINNTLVPIVL